MPQQPNFRPPISPESSAVDDARAAARRGDQVFQCQLNIEAVTGTAPFFGAGTTTSSAATSAVSLTLNAVCAEGWRLLNGSIAFIPESSESRDRVFKTGQAAATSGRLIGAYLFVRVN